MKKVDEWFDKISFEDAKEVLESNIEVIKYY